MRVERAPPSKALGCAPATTAICRSRTRGGATERDASVGEDGRGFIAELNVMFQKSFEA
jgi:hypothetical protein